LFHPQAFVTLGPRGLAWHIATSDLGLAVLRYVPRARLVLPHPIAFEGAPARLDHFDAIFVVVIDVVSESGGTLAFFPPQAGFAVAK
jgi:hypothetical protein